MAVWEKREERDVVVEPSSLEPCSEWTAAERRRCRCLDRSRRRRVAPEPCILRYFFDEKAENEPFSHDIDHNAKQIACSSRDDVWTFGEVQGDARGRDAVRVEPSRVRSDSSWSNLRGAILVTAWTARMTLSRPPSSSRRQ